MRSGLIDLLYKDCNLRLSVTHGQSLSFLLIHLSRHYVFKEVSQKEKATTDNKLVFTGTLQWTCPSKFPGIL